MELTIFVLFIESPWYRCMQLNEQLFSTILDTYPDWNESPEHFLRFITLVSGLSAIDLKKRFQVSETYGRDAELAAIFINVLKVNIDPYVDFADLKDRCRLEIDVFAELGKMYQKSIQDDALYELTSQTGIAPSMDTIKEEIIIDLLTRATIEELRPYILFY